MPGKRILVVEDEGIVALDIQSKLVAMGYEVPRVVASAEEAVSAAARLRPDLVLMDIQLEGDFDGVDAAQQIGADLAIPVVYLTAYSDEHTLERAKAAQPFGFLLKPFEERELYSTVEIAIYKHQMESERNRLEERLRQSQKMEAIAQLTSGVAHHFNLMLQGIIGNLDLAVMDASDDLRPLLDDAAYDADRAARLVRQLMLFYRQEQSEHTEVDVIDLLREVAQMCRGIFPRQIEFTLDAPGSLPHVMGNRGQLRQCLLNLCANGRDAVAEGPADFRPAVRIGAASVHADAHRVSTAACQGDGTCLRIDVSDNGVGMDDDARDHIFEPFYTTKEGGGPVGLGLAAAYGIIRDHGGWIECESRPGEGTTMSLFLPLKRDAPYEAGLRIPVMEPSPVPSAADLRPFCSRGDESVLVIADVDRFRKVLDLMLERHGYRVHLGRDGQDGANLYRHEHEGIDLVLLALSNPSGSTVEDVLNQLLRIQPRARTLIVTARPEGAGHWGRATGVLLQPFNTYQLLKAIRSILDR